MLKRMILPVALMGLIALLPNFTPVADAHDNDHYRHGGFYDRYHNANFNRRYRPDRHWRKRHQAKRHIHRKAKQHRRLAQRHQRQAIKHRHLANRYRPGSRWYRDRYRDGYRNGYRNSRNNRRRNWYRY